MHSRRDSKREALLPPPELLARYDEISPGLSKELVSLIKVEQKHRQSLQKKYLLHYRLGQLFGFGYGIYVVYKIFQLAQAGKTGVAYTLAGIFGVITILILSQYKEDRRSAYARSASKQERQQRREGREDRKPGGHAHRPQRQGFDRGRR